MLQQRCTVFGRQAFEAAERPRWRGFRKAAGETDRKPLAVLLDEAEADGAAATALPWVVSRANEVRFGGYFVLKEDIEGFDG